MFSQVVPFYTNALHVCRLPRAGLLLNLSRRGDLSIQKYLAYFEQGGHLNETKMTDVAYLVGSDLLPMLQKEMPDSTG